MSRRARLFIDGLPQLIKLKGHNNDNLFFDTEDYQKFIQCLDNAIFRYHLPLHAYALLPQQLLLLLTPLNKTTTGRFIQHIGRSYVPYFNRKYQRSGSLWQGRYDSCLIEPGAYLLLCQQYVDTLPAVENRTCLIVPNAVAIFTI